MTVHVLAALAQAGVVERSGSRGTRRLRATPRFLAHAEATAARLALRGTTPGATEALEAALGAWDGYLHDARQGARFLREFLGERDQLGALHPVFPVLEGFPARAAATG